MSMNGPVHYKLSKEQAGSSHHAGGSDRETFRTKATNSQWLASFVQDYSQTFWSKRNSMNTQTSKCSSYLP